MTFIMAMQKDLVRMNFVYIFKVCFIFSDGKLVKKIQVDEKPSTVVVEDKCDHK